MQDDCPCHVRHPDYSIRDGGIDCDYFLTAVLPSDKELHERVWAEIYSTEQAQTHHSIKRNGFIYENRESFFSRGQVRNFISATGEVVNIDKATQNYFDRYCHETITKKDLCGFVDGILAAIETYLTNKVSFGEVIDIIKPTKA